MTREEAIKAIKAWDFLDNDEKEILETLITELKESEDEKIRKALIEYFTISDNNSYYAVCGVDTKKILAWLEKQGDKPQEKTALEAIHEEKVDNTNKVEPKFKVKYAGSEYNVLEVKDIAGVIFYGIEDEPNHIYYVKPENCEIISGYVIKENGSPYPTKPAVFSEQKPTDNTEPKFHEDEWITNGQYNKLIVGINSDWTYYIFEDGTSQHIKYIDKKYHLWTIEDAKSGDVLIDVYGNIGIYEECDDFDWMSYCSLGHNGGFQYFKVEHENEKTHPATKEQRDFLFQKMKESSYEWDAEKKELDKIEKQGEQKKSYDVCDSSMMDNKKSPYGEKRDFGYFEEKPADKVEPKFKVGDWIVSKTSNLVYRVDSILLPQSKCYYLSHNGGKVLVSFTDEQDYHLWTIQDAKDGDVLSDGTTIFIFKDLLSDGSVMSYCDYDTDSGESDAFCPLSINLMCSRITPATKEQRDLLFSKMKESGYEWDNEKKEVKKIVPIFNVGDIIAKKHNSDINKFGQFTITDVSNGKYWYDEIIICGITEQDDWELVEQKSAEWSEEDELRVKDIIYFLDTAKKHYASTVVLDACIDWIKSIKQRIGR